MMKATTYKADGTKSLDHQIPDDEVQMFFQGVDPMMTPKIEMTQPDGETATFTYSWSTEAWLQAK